MIHSSENKKVLANNHAVTMLLKTIDSRIFYNFCICFYHSFLKERKKESIRVKEKRKTK